MAINRTVGQRFESAFCDALSKSGYWVHNMAQNYSGQPADVIAVKDKKALLIDCKVCDHDKFPLHRIEPNQHLAMQKCKKCGNGDAWFALRTRDHEVFMISYSIMQNLKYSRDTLDIYDIKSVGIPFERWIAEW